VAVGAQADDGHRQRVGVEELGEAPLALAQRRLGVHAVGDVDQRGQDARAAVDDHDVGVGDGDDLASALRPKARLDVADRAARAESIIIVGSLTRPGAACKLLYQAVVAPGCRIHTLSASRWRRATSSAIRRGGSSYGSRASAKVPQ